MKLKDLKAYEPPTQYEGRGGDYQPIPHYDLLKAILTASSDKLAFDTVVEDRYSSMVSVVTVVEDTPFDLVPTMIVVSCHNGRQPAEVVFGHRYVPGNQLGHRPVMVTSDFSVVKRHRITEEGVAAWAEEACATFRKAFRRRRSVVDLNKWWTVASQTTLTTSQAMDRVTAFVGLTSGRPTKAMPPLQKRTGVLPVLELMVQDQDGLGFTVAGMLMATVRAIDAGESRLASLYRKISLFRRLGDDTPPDVFGDGNGEGRGV